VHVVNSLFSRDWNWRAAPGHHSTPHHAICRNQRDPPAGRLAVDLQHRNPAHSSLGFVARSRSIDGQLSLVKYCSPQRLKFQATGTVLRLSIPVTTPPRQRNSIGKFAAVFGEV
jgi:hypothetical protein